VVLAVELAVVAAAATMAVPVAAETVDVRVVAEVSLETVEVVPELDPDEDDPDATVLEPALVEAEPLAEAVEELPVVALTLEDESLEDDEPLDFPLEVMLW